MIMGKKYEKKIKLAVITLVTLFGVWNLLWYTIVYSKYNNYAASFPKSRLTSYVITEGNLTYSVKKPNYLRLTGNLGIVDTKEGLGLIIWPKIKGGYKYGVIVNDGKQQYQITLDSDFTAEDKDQQAIVDKNRIRIDNVIQKANEMWHLK